MPANSCVESHDLRGGFQELLPFAPFKLDPPRNLVCAINPFIFFELLIQVHTHRAYRLLTCSVSVHQSQRELREGGILCLAHLCFPSA